MPGGGHSHLSIYEKLRNNITSHASNHTLTPLIGPPNETVVTAGHTLKCNDILYSNSVVKSHPL